MAAISFNKIALVFLCYVIYRVVASVLSRRRFKSFAAQHGCEEPIDVTARSFPPGWARIRRMMNSKKIGEDILDDIIVPDFATASTVKLRMFEGTTLINTIDPANLQAMLATQFKDFGIGHRRHQSFSPLLGRSIFTSDGQFWEHSRALFRPQFARENINDLAMTDQAARDLIEAIGAADSQGWTTGTKMMPLFYNFTLDTATHFLFGESIGSQTAATAIRRGNEDAIKSDPARAAKLEDAKVFVDSFDIINDTLLKRIRLQSLYWLADSLEFRKAVRRVLKFTDHFVKLAVDKASSPQENTNKKDSLLYNLATQTQNRGELRDQTMAILVAGRDTTAALLGWCIERLALHPDVFDKLRSTVLRDLPANETITFEKLKSCRYLQHFINEVLRLHPLVPMNMRIAIKDTTLPVGGGTDGQSPIAIRKGQIVGFTTYGMQRSKRVWGENALDFKPERWEQRNPAWHFIPFLGGPRICIGQQFALTEASFALCRILQNFDAIEPVDKLEMAKMKKGVGITMWPMDAVNVRFHAAAR